MKTIELTLYKFSELSEEAKRTAIDEHRYINIKDNWWNNVYEDAKNIGLKIKGFDLLHQHINAEFIGSAYETSNLIMEQHGEQCETYRTVKKFKKDWEELVKKHSDGINIDKVAEGNEDNFDEEADEMEADFLQSISEDYRIILSNECEYLESDEAVSETLEINEYDFTEDGKRY